MERSRGPLPPIMQRSNLSSRFGRCALLCTAVTLGVQFPGIGLATPSQAQAALSTAWGEVQKLRAQVDKEQIVPKFGQKAQAILQGLEKRLDGASPDLEAAIDGALEALFLRQLMLVEDRLVKKYLHSASPAKALAQAEKSYGQAAEDLVRPNSSWSFASAQKEFVTELAQEMRQELALTEERQRTAQTQRATADIIGKIQTQMDYLAGKLRQSSTGGPWMFWTSYRLPGTPIFVSGRYQDGRTNIELNLAPNKDPTNAEAGFVESLTPQNLGLSLNVGL